MILFILYLLIGLIIKILISKKSESDYKKDKEGFWYSLHESCTGFMSELTVVSIWFYSFLWIISIPLSIIGYFIIYKIYLFLNKQISKLF